MIGGADLAQSQLALANAFVQRPDFLVKYPTSLATGAQFVDAILGTVKDDLGRRSFLPTKCSYRFPTEIIGHRACLYFRFALSFRDVEEMMASRGVSVTYESVRQWCLTFGQT